MDGAVGKCGTAAGYEKHRRDGTDICQPCKDAHVRYNKEWLLKKDLGRNTSDLIPMQGTLRRIQALMTLGWPLTYILEQSDIIRRSIHKFENADRVQKSQADRIAKTYRKLMLRPATNKEVRQQHITQTVRKAKEAGYAGPMDWHDIDTDIRPTITRNKTQEA